MTKIDSSPLKELLTSPDAWFVQLWGVASNGLFVKSQMSFGADGMAFDLDMSTAQGRLGWVAMFVFWLCMGVITMHRRVSAARKDRSETETVESKAKTSRLEEILKQANIQKDIDLANQIKADTEITVLKLNKIKRDLDEGGD